jgi:hypothetical protein
MGETLLAASSAEDAGRAGRKRRTRHDRQRRYLFEACGALARPGSEHEAQRHFSRTQIQARTSTTGVEIQKEAKRMVVRSLGQRRVRARPRELAPRTRWDRSSWLSG